MNSAIPMVFGICVQSPRYNREGLIAVEIDVLDDVIVVPQKQRSLRYLEMGTFFRSKKCLTRLVLCTQCFDSDY